MRQRHVREGADREAQPQGVGAEPGIGAEREAEPDRIEADEQDDERPEHRAVRAHRSEQDQGHSEQEEAPGGEDLDVPGDRQRRAVAAEEQRERRPVGDGEQRRPARR